MTDRFNALAVVLEKDIREDDAQAIIAAIGQLRGVLSVSGHVSTMDSHAANERAKREIGEKLFAVLSSDRAKR